MAKLVALLVMATPTPAPARWVVDSDGSEGLSCSQVCKLVGAECDAAKFQTANEGLDTEAKFTEVMKEKVEHIGDYSETFGCDSYKSSLDEDQDLHPPAPWVSYSSSDCVFQTASVSCEIPIKKWHHRLCWCTPRPETPCSNRGTRQCKRAHAWWNTFFLRFKPGSRKFMDGFLHDTCFAECRMPDKRFAMVIEAHKDCPTKIHTRRSTKIFGKLARLPREFCRRPDPDFRVCSYCLHIPSFRKHKVTIVKSKRSILKTPEVCKLTDNGFPNTPCESEDRRV